MEFLPLVVFLCLFFGAVVLIFGTLAFVAVKAARSGSVLGMLLKGRVVHTYGEVDAQRRSSLVTRSLGRVHCIETDQGPLVALEVATTTPGSWRMQALALDRVQAAALATLLQRALHDL